MAILDRFYRDVEAPPPVSARKSLLIVDADTKSLRVLEVSLRKVGFNVATADTAAGALQAALTAPPDLVITDTRLPDFDGFELCRRLRKDPRTSHAVLVFLTEGASPELKVRGIDVGADEFLTKPVLVKEIIGRIRNLLERRQSTFGGGDRPGALSGTLANMGVVDLLQVMEAGQKSGVAKIGSDPVRSGGYVEGRREQGLLFFRDGQVVDAELGRLRAEDAVYRMLLWEDGLFDVEFGSVAREDTIQRPTQDLLLEGLRRVDEWSKHSESIPPLQARLRADLSALSRRRTAPPREVQDLLGLFDGRRTLFEVVAQSNVDESKALKILAALNEQGVLQPAEDASVTDVEALDAWLEDAPPEVDLPSVLEQAMIPSPQTPSEIMAAADPNRPSIRRQRLSASHVGPIPGATTETGGRRRPPSLKVQKIGGTSSRPESASFLTPTEDADPRWSTRPSPPHPDVGWTGGTPWTVRQDAIDTLDLKRPRNLQPAYRDPSPRTPDPTYRDPREVPTLREPLPTQPPAAAPPAAAPPAPAPAAPPAPAPTAGGSVTEQAQALSQQPASYVPSETSTFRDDFFSQQESKTNPAVMGAIVVGVLAVLVLIGLMVLQRDDAEPELTPEEKMALADAAAEPAAPAEAEPVLPSETAPAEEAPPAEAVAALAETPPPEPPPAPAKALPRKPAPVPEAEEDEAPLFTSLDDSAPASNRSKKELLTEADDAFERAQLSLAETNYRQVVDKDPKNAAALAGLAHVALERREDSEALRLAEEALSVDSRAGRPYLVRAQVKINRQDKAGALKDYEAYLKNEPRGAYADDVERIVAYLESATAELDTEE
jgi:CheY-like chemotaxis protein